MKVTAEYKDRPFNIRPLCLWAFFVGATVAACMVSLWAAAVWITALVSGLFALHIFGKSKDKLLSFLKESRAFFIGSAAICLAVILSFGVTRLIYTQQKSFAGTHLLSGTVETYNFNYNTDDIKDSLNNETKNNDTPDKSNDFGYIVISNATFNKTKISGRVFLGINNTDDFFITKNEKVLLKDFSLNAGDKISIQARLRAIRAADQNAEDAAADINNRTKYSATAAANEITVDGKDNSVRFVLLRHTKNFLNNHMDSDNADLILSMLFGDKTSLDDEISENFRISGLAHILAVSGLHVGLIIAIVGAVLKGCRLRRKFQFPIIAAVLLFYCYLCDFRFSIIRASIMFLVLLFNRIYLRKADLLSSLCFAAIITLVFFPYALLSASFLLSYACMFGIALFYHPTEKLLNKTLIKNAPKWITKIQRYFYKGIAMYICVTITTLPLIIKYFEVISVVGLLSNLIFLPLLIVAFQAALVAVLTWAAFPLLYPVNFLLDIVRNGTQFLANLPFAQIHASNSGYWFLFYFAAITIMLRFVFAPSRYKNLCAVLLLGVYLVGFMV